MADLFTLVGRILIKNEEANKNIDDTTQKAKDLKDAIEGTSSRADTAGQKIGSSGKLGKSTVWMGNMLTKATEKAAAFGKFIVKTGFGFDARMEAYQNQFEALLGDADKASKLVDDIQLLAKISPLGMEGLANNAVSLLNTGTELEEIIPTLEMLGNLSLGDQNKMNSVVRAYTQILSKGLLMAQEMYQLGDAGVPLREIMTLYGGERYADGEWFMKKMSDPDYKVPAEDMVNAFRMATAEGGKWNDYMFKMMDTWLGQTDRMGEEGKESIGKFMQPFFEVAKSEVLPKAADSLEMFGKWAEDNKGTISEIADIVGKFASITFDKAIEFFKWMVDNSSAVAAAATSIATAMVVGSIAAHPYATAVMAVAAGLAYLNSEAGKKRGTYDHMFDVYTQEDIETLNQYVDALNAMKEAQDVSRDDYDFEKQVQAENAYDAALEKLLAIKDLYQTYNTWLSAQEGYQGADGLALKVELKTSDNAETDVQNEISEMPFQAYVTMHADTSMLQAGIDATGLQYTVPVYGGTANVDGSHASGLDFVPRDNYIARLHKGEAVLTSSQADTWRSGGMGSADVGRLESAINAMTGMLQQLVASSRSGTQIVLDSGVLVGQLAPALDTQLGTISTRKGRRN